MRAVRNTELMLDSSTRALAANGWASFTLASVAREMGISERPVRNRARSRSDLAAITWTERSGPLLVAAVARCMAGLNQERETGDSADLCGALMAMLSRGIELDAAADLLICSNFDPEVAEAVDADLAPLVRRLITPGQSLSPDDAARAAYVLALTFGLLFMARYPRAQGKRVGEALPVWVAALTSDVTAQPLPKEEARHIDVSPVLAADDPALDALLSSTLELIGTRGFDGVTVAEIARQAGFTEGLVFNRSSSKLDMFIDATRRQNEAGWKLNHDFAMALEDDFGQGIADVQRRSPPHRAGPSGRLLPADPRTQGRLYGSRQRRGRAARREGTTGWRHRRIPHQVVARFLPDVRCFSVGVRRRQQLRQQ